MWDSRKSERFNRNRKKEEKTEQKEKTKAESIVNSDCKTMQAFRMYAKTLDDKNDKFERIVKLSRDITIESKRIIFLLHTLDRETVKDSVLLEAEKRLEALISHQWKLVAQELDGEDPFQYRRAFSPGIQEFIEAYTYLNFLKTSNLHHWDYYQKKLEYEVGPTKGELDNTEGLRKCDAEGRIIGNKREQEETGVKSSERFDTSDGEEVKKKIWTTLMPTDFFLGLADVTGELMRKCINCLGSGNPDGSFETCCWVRSLYCGFLSINVRANREMSQKMFTLKQNLLKMELACYNIHVRGSECDKLILTDIDASKTYVHDDQ